jgi:outer membrane immunogenic protein
MNMTTLIRNLTLSALLTVPSLIAAPALAADLPYYKAPPRAAAPYSWSGFYIGANVGAGFGKADVRGNDLPISSTINLPPLFEDYEEDLADIIGNGTSSFSQGNNPSGLIGGAQIGFNVQSGAFVFGLEADFQGSMQKDRSSRSDGFGIDPFVLGIPGIAYANVTLDGTLDTQYQTKIDWFGTVRGRIGIAQDTLLVYATGGLAYGRVKVNGTTTTDGGIGIQGCAIIVGCTGVFDIPFEANASSFGGSKVNYGWTLGGGIEWAATANLSFKAEYLYMDLGSVDATGTSPTGEDYSVHAKFTNQVVRVGFNYKLGSPY